MTLLDKAQVAKDTASQRELAELAVAWVMGRVSSRQANTVLGVRPGNLTAKLAKGLVYAVRLGLLVEGKSALFPVAPDKAGM